MSIVKLALTLDVPVGSSVVALYNNDMGYPKPKGHYVYYDGCKYDMEQGEINVTLQPLSAIITNTSARQWDAGEMLCVEFQEYEEGDVKTVYLSQQQYDNLIVVDECTRYTILEV